LSIETQNFSKIKALAENKENPYPITVKASHLEIEGPDGLFFNIYEHAKLDRFRNVALRCSDIQKSRDYWV